jgi:hypothetical protein
MIRPLTFLSVLAFIISGAYMFAVKHRAEMLDDQLAQVSQATRLDEQRIRVLQAQWALEVDPSRLAQLSSAFTTLQPMRPGQLVTLADLRGVLPPPGSAVPGENPQNSVAPMPNAADAPIAQAAPVLPLPPAPAPLRLARATATASEAAPAVATDRLADVETLLRSLPRHPHPHRAVARHEYASARPLGGSLLAPLGENSVPLALMGAQVMSVRAVAPAPAAAAPADTGGSMLGMAQSGGG